MIIQDKIKVGKKGEILPKKPLREVAGIYPGDEVLVMAYPGELIIRKIYSVEELFSRGIISNADNCKRDSRKSRRGYRRRA